jgi:hypothetical protein
MLRGDTKLILKSFQHYCQMFNMNLPKHGEDKNVIDGLNNKLIKIFQEDGLKSHMNMAKVLVRPKA